MNFVTSLYSRSRFHCVVIVRLENSDAGCTGLMEKWWRLTILIG
jgi:hypothetical protein